MSTLYDSLKKFVPKPLVDLRRLRRAYDEDTSMAAKWQQPDPALLTRLQALPTREDMLDRLPKGGRVAEIGVAAGRFAAEIHTRTAPEKLYLIDAWDFTPMPDCSEPGLAKVRAHFADGLNDGSVEIRRGYSSVMLKEFEDASLDWVYVDAGHEYENVKADIEECRRVVKPGGIIAGHDYIRFDSPLNRYGVVEAVNAFVNEARAEFLYITMDYDASFALRLPG